MSDKGEKPRPDRMEEETVLVIGMGNRLLAQNSLSPLWYEGVWEMLSHLPDGSGSLSQLGLGGSLGGRIQGEFLASKGGGGGKEGLGTITGV